MTASLTPNKGRNAGRIVLIVVGACFVLLALLPLAAGGVLVGVHSTQRDANGFYASGANPLSTSTHALVSETLDVGTDGPDWLFRKGRLGTIRVTAEGTAARPIFIGIARQSQIDSYLQGVAHDEIKDFDLDPFTVRTVRQQGASSPARPAGQTIWAQSANGTGRQSIVWQVKNGDWAVVVMNADASRGVSTDITVGAKLDLFLWLGIALIVIGAILLFGGGAMIFGGTRRAQPSTSAVPSPVTAGASS